MTWWILDRESGAVDEIALRGDPINGWAYTIAPDHRAIRLLGAEVAWCVETGEVVFYAESGEVVRA